MTTFSENPHEKGRKKLERETFYLRLNKTLDDKFGHKPFAERFAMANTAFWGLGFIAQFASLTTAFTMLTYMFTGVNIVICILCSGALVLIIEAIKRESTNDVMKGFFQYRSVEKFPALLALITVGASIYISIEGAKILPDILIYDAIEEVVISKTPDAINTDFAARIAGKETERDEYRKNRMWKGRLASKDAKVIKEYNQDIKSLQEQKDQALIALNVVNEAAKTSVSSDYQNEVERVKTEREALSKQLVITAITFEVLFLLSLCFEWWYFTESRKEKETSNPQGETLEVLTESSNSQPKRTLGVIEKTLEVIKQKLESNGKTLEVEGNPRSQKKPSFVDYETKAKTTEVKGNVLEVGDKAEWTRKCKRCSKPFVHTSANHKYCERSCMLAQRADDQKAKKIKNQ